MEPAKGGGEAGEIGVGGDPNAAAFDGQCGVGGVGDSVAADARIRTKATEDGPMAGAGPDGGTTGLSEERVMKRKAPSEVDGGSRFWGWSLLVRNLVVQVPRGRTVRSWCKAP